MWHFWKLQSVTGAFSGVWRVSGVFHEVRRGFRGVFGGISENFKEFSGDFGGVTGVFSRFRRVSDVFHGVRGSSRGFSVVHILESFRRFSARSRGVFGSSVGSQVHYMASEYVSEYFF